MSDLFESGAEPLFDPAADTDPSLPPVTQYVGVNRNKRLTDEIDVLGDVHLGKVFKTGVPLDRKGEREETVWADFEVSLMASVNGIHVQVGDLFDAFDVPNEVVLRAAKIYIEAAKYNPGTFYIIYRGNHDASRTSYKASSFDVFREIVASVRNIQVFTHVIEWNGLAFIPWHPFESAANLAARLDGTYDVVFGHWDTKSFGDDSNLIPLEQLVGKTKSVVTGHEHTPREFDIGTESEGGQIHVTVVGSMQPYSHGEDADGEVYVTMTPEEYTFAAAQGKDFSHKCIRFALKEGEVAPANVNALAVTTKTVTEEGEAPSIDVDLGTFDLGELLDMSLEEAGVDRAYAAKVGEQFNSLRAAA